MIIYDTQRCQEWAAKHYGIAANELTVCIGFERHGELVCVAGYNYYHGNSICVHFYSQGGYVSKQYLVVVHAYPFLQLGVSFMVAMISTANKKALNLARKLGYEPKTIVPGVFNDGDLMIATLKKTDCRYIYGLA